MRINEERLFKVPMENLVKEARFENALRISTRTIKDKLSNKASTNTHTHARVREHTHTHTLGSANTHILNETAKKKVVKIVCVH